MPYSIKTMRNSVIKHGSVRAAAKSMGIPESTLRGILKRSIDREYVQAAPVVEVPPQGFVVKRNSVAYNKDGDVSGQWVQTTSGPGEVFKPLPGQKIKGESALVDPAGQILAKWVKTGEATTQAPGVIDALEAVFGRYAGLAPLVPAPAHTMDVLHTIYPLADLHVGMYSWGQETGEDYDVTIAADRTRSAYARLITGTAPSKSCTLLNLGDFFHANDAKFVTPGHGHLLDVDGRHPRVLEAGAEIMLDIIGLLLDRHEMVEVVCLVGNHDPDTTAALRVALRLFYRNHDRVTVDNSPRMAWYKRFGKCLFGATHGHTAKMPEVSGMMACDVPQDWGLTEYRSYFTGHVHHERALEKAGVRAESFQTLASRDAFAAHGPWRSGHSVQSITFHQDQGEVARSRVNVIAQTHKAI